MGSSGHSSDPYPSHYNLLGVHTDATTADIKQAFRQLARSWHPDKGGDAQKFALIQAAAAVLLDPKQRAVYDQVRDLPELLDPSKTAEADRPNANDQHDATSHRLQTKPIAISLDDVWDDSDDGYHENGDGHSKSAAESATAAGAPDRGMLEGLMLDVLASQGVVCDAGTQMVVTCEVCRRPATKECWICGTHICELCTRCQHWKGAWGWHWPLVNAPGSMALALAKKEFEAKRMEDANRYLQQQPGYIPQTQRTAIRDFQEAAAAFNGIAFTNRVRCYNAKLARYHMWAQTEGAAYVAVHLPEGTPQNKAQISFGDPPGVLRVWSAPSKQSKQQTESRAVSVVTVPRGQTVVSGLPVIERLLAGSVDHSAPLEINRTSDNRYLIVCLPKAEPGMRWRALFSRDSDGLREVPAGGHCLYRLHQDVDEVTMELDLPYWVVTEDVTCNISEQGVYICVRGVMEINRTFWKAGKDAGSIVDVKRSSWALTASSSTAAPHTARMAVRQSRPRLSKLLTVFFVKRPLSSEEQTYKHGVRQDNLACTRKGGRPGPAAFFTEDEDEWGLTALLQAHVFKLIGKVYVSPCPWEATPSKTAGDGRWEYHVQDLPQEVQHWLKGGAEAEE